MSNRKKQILVLDFDGTITDAEEEGKPYVAGFVKDLCLLVGKKLDEVAPVIESAAAIIAADPGGNGWMYKGFIVAPATVDPYLRMRAIARQVFNHFGVFLHAGDREALLDFLYTKNYSLSFSGMAFKEGAEEMLLALRALEEVATSIVTNSDTAGVREKIAVLGESNDTLTQLSKHVIGGAKKYLVGDAPSYIEESMTLPGLPRPVYLRRSAYYDILEKLRIAHDVRWEDITVVGDIFELDLALPFALGARIGLVVNEFTPAYEQNFIAAHPDRARCIRSLNEVVSFVTNR